jgi:hypothetical protein
MSNPNLPANYWLPGVQGSLYQIVAPDGRAIVNFMPYGVTREMLQGLQTQYPFAQFAFQAVPVDQLEAAQ